MPTPLRCSRRSTARPPAFGCLVLLLAGTASSARAQDETAYARRAEVNCSAGDASSCIAAAHRYDEGALVPLDRPRAVRLYRSACDLGQPEGCGEAGRILTFALSRDQQTAIELLEKGCAGGYTTSCWHLGLALEKRGDYVRAAEVLRGVCDGSSDTRSFACADLGVLYEEGKGVRQDYTRAAELFRGSRTRDTRHRLALLYANGRGVPQSRARAEQLLDENCGDVPGGYIHLPSCEALHTLWREDCNRGVVRACEALATAHANGFGGLERSQRRATDYWRKACAAAGTPSCASPPNRFRWGGALWGLGIGYGAPQRLSGSLTGEIAFATLGEEMSDTAVVSVTGSAGLSAVKAGVGPGVVTGVSIFSVRAIAATSYGHPLGAAPDRIWYGGEVEWSLVHLATVQAGVLIPVDGPRDPIFTWSVGVGIPLIGGHDLPCPGCH